MGHDGECVDVKLWHHTPPPLGLHATVAINEWRDGTKYFGHSLQDERTGDESDEMDDISHGTQPSQASHEGVDEDIDLKDYNKEPKSYPNSDGCVFHSGTGLLLSA